MASKSKQTREKVESESKPAGTIGEKMPGENPAESPAEKPAEKPARPGAASATALDNEHATQVTAQQTAPLQPAPEDLKPRRTRRTKEQIATERLAEQTASSVALTEKSRAATKAIVNAVTPLGDRMLPPPISDDERNALIEGGTPVMEMYGGDIPPVTGLVVIVVCIYGPRLLARWFGDDEDGGADG